MRPVSPSPRPQVPAPVPQHWDPVARPHPGSPVPTAVPGPVPGSPPVRPTSPMPAPRPAPLLRPMVHSRFLRRTCGSPSSAPRRRSLPHGCCCGGCSPSPGRSIGFTSDETRKRRVRPGPRRQRLRPAAPPRRPRHAAAARAASPPTGSRRPPAPAALLPPAPRRTRNRPRGRRRRCQRTSRIPQLIREAGPAASGPCDWLVVATTERGG